ncbi:hypothetical protein [Pseudosulfitobacter pseudonitzschiae]|uniref:hypothetical protein n=1 Tax=Pseudosulfitobacter pseudonitzschiae TaxID=1402135 RepID=UPI001AF4AEC8|nr:hypothetical protein [Pseudosulfitobacter pseudonitzschiae]MBM1815376.1 hypothetical protein [Pseudosulfitobacter pseudonitzschiae]MBM1832367.1 hypothetical protein [Pseudosulfitobacter pseudonitzschiae]MBM1837235.1 hypothetical protein [Pseudosulfitobacter pseudonitzschiae]MBM1842081.1 hypothetical protein [Pseudosulfitobacter pseudonitzschiae]MBM1846949.1 hypothetical protein [Pseudosulfitobacter pseudonitzschiae]
MKPNFALSLSFDGIRLLHRAAGGWRVVGEVSLAAEDMAAELAALRKTASDLEPRGVRSKLVIPNEQIRYLTIDSGDIDTEGRWSAAFAALEGATPYAVDELSIDICADGTQTHIAAVARETLDEAEAFAMQHRFHPVSFVSIPGEAGFLGEPFLGVTRHAADLLEPGDEVTPDGIAVVVVGDIKTPVGPVVTEDVTPVAAKEMPPVADADVPAPVEDAEAATVEAPAAEPKPAPDAKPAPAPEPKPAPEAKPAPAPEPTPAPEAKPAQPTPAPEAAAPPATEAAPEAATLKPEPAKPEATPEPDPATFGFASRRTAAANPPALGGANRKDSPAAPAPLSVTPRVTPVPVAEKPAQAAPKAGAKPPSESATTPMDLAKASVTGFMSRRRKPKRINPAAAPLAQTAHPIADPPADEAQRMTVFGARSKPGDKVGGKPRYMGLILTAALLVFLAGVAAWASVFLDEGLARFFNRAEDPVVVEAPPEILPEPDPEQIEDGAEVASLDPSLSDEDAAVLDALGDPQAQPEEEPAIDPERERQAAEARYAVTGIWPLAPQEPEAAPVVPLEDLYVASIDPVSPARDAVALPAPASLDTDLTLVALPSPAAAGTSFARDSEGRVIPTEEGAVTPNGVTLFKGRPAVVPPPTPTRFAEAPEVNPELERLGRARPRARPDDLIENAERANLGGLTRNELAEVRPKLRPAVAKVEEEKDEVPTAQATTVSFRPNGRPRNFDRTVARARAAQPEPTQAAAVAPMTTTAPVAVAPKIPSKTSVAAGATVKNAINLRKVNLIGVYGKPSSRRALVRLSNGRYQKVQVGDRIDGGRVSAIGDSELRYQKGGRNVVLKMP